MTPTDDQIAVALAEIREAIMKSAGEPRWDHAMSSLRDVATLLAIKNLQIETQTALLHAKVHSALPPSPASVLCRHSHPADYDCQSDCLMPNLR